MSVQVCTVTAGCRSELEFKVQLKLEQGWSRVDGARRLLFDGKPLDGRAEWAQSLERRR